MKTLQELALSNAVGEVLSSWPDDMSDADILSALEAGDDDDIIAWEPYEGYSAQWLAEQIASTAQGHLSVFRLIQSGVFTDNGTGIVAVK